MEQKKKKKLNPMLLNVLLISGLVHVAAILILGGITVVKFIIPDDAEFEEPPAIEEVEPPKEVKIEIKQQAAPQNQPLNNLRMKQVGNIAIANVDVDLPSMEQSFTVSSGLGNLGGGSLLSGTRGSIGMGVSDINVFGLKSRAERVLFVIDANRGMLTDNKGGLYSYNIIKAEIAEMIGNLSAGTLFNVAFFDDSRFMFFRPQPVPAGVEITNELKEWIAPVNADIKKLGIRGGSPAVTTLKDHPVHQEMVHYGSRSGNEALYMSQVFLEQSIDAVFIITGNHRGIQSIERRPTEKEKEEWARVVEKPEYQRALAAYNAESPEISRLAREALKKENEARAKRGIPPKVINGSLADIMGIKRKTRHPGGRPRHFIDQRSVEKYLKELVKILYDNKGSEPPSINVVLFLAGDEVLKEEHEDALKDYVRFFSGKHRVIRGLNEITAASTAAETKN